MRVRNGVILCLFAVSLRAQTPTVIEHADRNPNLSANPTFRKNIPFQVVAVPPFSLKTYADKLEEKLKGHAAGYQFVVSFNDQAIVKRAGGAARRAPDNAPRTMTVNDKYNLASISKTITAAAALKILDARNVSLDSPMHKFLPKSFTPGTNVTSITFRELLTHRSGIRCTTEVTRGNLETCIANGVKLEDKAVSKYNNSNFALFRYLIPELEDFKRFTGTTPQQVPPIQLAKNYSKRYMDYVQKNVFDPAGLPAIFCKPTDAQPALCYQYPCPIDAGTDFGDMTETNGSRGWTMSTTQLAAFFGTLLYTEKILPKDLRDKMKNENLGLYQASVKSGVVAYNHAGGYPGKNDNGDVWNAGELNSLVYGTSNGVSVALVINSQVFNPPIGHSMFTAVHGTAVEMSK
jgi:CubicO group peptidase (beta-lactamase class C family)